MHEWIGKKLANNYRLLTLWRGGKSGLFEAEQISLERSVWVHVFPVKDAKQKASTLQKIQATAALNHPNIVSILDFGTTGNIVYVVYEKPRGETLANWLRAGIRWPIPVSKDISRQIATAVAEAYKNRTPHGNLTPENVFIEQKSADRFLVKIAGFFVDAAPASLADLIATDRRQLARVIGNVMQTSSGDPGGPQELDRVNRLFLDQSHSPMTIDEIVRQLQDDTHGVPCLACGTPLHSIYCGHCGIENPPPRRRLARGTSKRLTTSPEFDEIREVANNKKETLSVQTGGQTLEAPTPLLGREFLLQHLEDLLSTSSPKIFMKGPSGIGKRALLKELHGRTKGKTAVYSAAPDPTGLKRSFFPLTTLLQKVLGLSGTITERSLRASFARLSLPDALLPAACRFFHCPHNFVSLEPRANQQNSVFFALRTLATLGERFPHSTLFLKNFEEWDNLSQQVLLRFAAVAQPRIAILGTTTGKTPRQFSTIAVEPLTRAETLSLVGKHQSPDEIPDYVFETPGAALHFYHWRLFNAQVPVHRFPPSLSALVEQRISDLSPACREALQFVAAQGLRSTQSRLFDWIPSLNPSDFARPELAGLLETDGNNAWIPSEAIARQVISIAPRRALQMIHHRIAESLPLSAPPEVRGYHLHQAGQRNAIEDLITAGQMNASFADYDGAEKNWGTALQIARTHSLMTGDSSQLTAVSLDLAEIYVARRHFRMAQSILDEIGDVVEGNSRCRLLLIQSQIDKETSYELAMSRSRLAIRAGMIANSPSLMAQAYIVLAEGLIELSRFNRAREELVEALSVVNKGLPLTMTEHPQESISLTMLLASVSITSGELEKAHALYSEVLVVARKHHLPLQEARATQALFDQSANLSVREKHDAYITAFNAIRRLGDARAEMRLLQTLWTHAPWQQKETATALDAFNLSPSIRQQPKGTPPVTN